MAFYELRLDPAIGEVADGGPDFEPVVITAQESGDETRTGTKDKGLSNWTISYNAAEPEVWEAIQDHFYIVRGRLGSWPFKDWYDFACSTTQAYLNPIDSTHWQMCKRRSQGSYTYDQLIILPILVRTTVVGTGTYSVSRTTGIITKSAGADPTGFVCEFDKLVRYDVLRLPQRIATHHPDGDIFVDLAGLAIKEIPLDSA